MSLGTHPNCVHSSSTNDKRLDHIGIEIVQFNGKLAGVRENAGFGSLGELSPVGRGRAAVAKHAFNVLANAAVGARRHAGNEAESSDLTSARIIGMFVCTLRPVRAFWNTR